MEWLPSPRNLDPAGMNVGLDDRVLVLRQMTSAAYLVEHIRSQLGLVGIRVAWMLLSFAFMESLCIYGLVIALAILFAKYASTPLVFGWTHPFLEVLGIRAIQET